MVRRTNWTRKKGKGKVGDHTNHQKAGERNQRSKASRFKGDTRNNALQASRETTFVSVQKRNPLKPKTFWLKEHLFEEMANKIAENITINSSKTPRKAGKRSNKDDDPEWTPHSYFLETPARVGLSNPGDLKRSNSESEKENVQESEDNVGNSTRKRKRGVENMVTSPVQNMVTSPVQNIVASPVENMVTSSVQNGKLMRQIQDDSSEKWLGRQENDASKTCKWVGGNGCILFHVQEEKSLPNEPPNPPAQSSSKEESTYYLTSPYKETLKKNKPRLDFLQKTGKPFIQDDPCFIIDPQRELPYCRECPPKESLPKEEIVCRFFAFRFIRYSSGKLQVAGFSDPYKDISQEDLDLWMTPVSDEASCPNPDLICLSKRILHFAGDQFCFLLHKEKNAVDLDMSRGVSCHKWDVFWKRAIGVRETCDVCLTSLFNYHWTCEKCGFAVCIDCYQARKTSSKKAAKKQISGKDSYLWALCHNNKMHIQKHLMLTQIIAGDALIQLDEQYHKVRKAVSQGCLCEAFANVQENSSNDRYVSGSSSNGNIRVNTYPGGSQSQSYVQNTPMLTSVTANNNSAPYPSTTGGTCTISWLCSGRLLWLKNPTDQYMARTAFQLQWVDGLPVLVSGLTRDLDLNLWKPEAFSSELGDVITDMVDCMTGLTISDQPMKKFWDGFNDVSKRLVDESGSPMILKLKDWPPGDDFAKVLPTRFEDLMKALPMREYTHRSSLLNLVSWLPEVFVRPDLGPKMYTAYGAAQPNAGTTNLHLDMSDAVNVLVYVGLPTDGSLETSKEEVLKVISEAGCDSITQKRVRQADVLPGALWHIYPVSDACGIRSLLTRVAAENNMNLDPKDDPIHDQSWYLDKKLRDRLYNEYGVEGYTIVQCLGDAVFIPAGAPHQVLNLHNCIKVAEDFVSPENIAQCFQLTKEFRDLSDEHRNHEDLLQIKNILYHAVKGAVSTLDGNHGN